MPAVELRNLDEARRYVLQGLWLLRAEPPTAARVRPALEWSLEIAASGYLLPPVGIVADLGSLVFGVELTKRAKEPTVVPNWPVNLGRSYEDHVLGKIDSDTNFDRASDGLRRYVGPDRTKGLAYLINQISERLGVGGVDLSPAVIRGLLTMNPAELLKEGYESLENDGPMPLLVEQYEAWVKASRRFGELLGAEDAVAIEQRTALADLTQYVAHRQILQQTALLESQLPTRPIRPLVGRKEVPTRILDEDHYPIGGYTSISNRGSMESLLHSQLAFMETEERPDLFDIKYARDELFYYSRDENQFLRRRRTFVFCFAPDLVATRYKDPELPCQRIVLISAVVLTLIRRLEEWLGFDALRFELIFPKLGNDSPLSQEAKLFEILLLELRSRSVAFVIHADGNDGLVLEDSAAILKHCATLSRAAQVQVLEFAAAPTMVGPEGVLLLQCGIDGPQPHLVDARGSPIELDADPVESWLDAVRKILATWI